MKIIENERFGTERALYNARDVHLIGCRFEGEEDGESALKESGNVVVENCYMDLRYPFWHVKNLKIVGGEATERCRAAIWYSSDIDVRDARLMGIKALRECERIVLRDTTVVSPEFGWHTREVAIEHCDLTAEYAFLGSRDIRAERLKFQGKYSFQYCENVRIADSELKTKDAFWHAKNVTVTDCTIEGEYLGWYAENLTFVRCHIKGTQPLCYCKGLKLIDCTMENADLAFEYSDVEADVRGEILSVKNVRSGKIVADKIGKIINTPDSVYPCRATVIANATQ